MHPFIFLLAICIAIPILWLSIKRYNPPKPKITARVRTAQPMAAGLSRISEPPPGLPQPMELSAQHILLPIQQEQLPEEPRIQPPPEPDDCELAAVIAAAIVVAAQAAQDEELIPAEATTEAEAEVTVEEIINEEDDHELISVIMAAVAAILNTTPDKFVVRSVRRVSLWNTAAKLRK